MGGNENMLKENERIVWIDIAKGIAILLVVFGHNLDEENVVRMFVYSFHVPFFIMIGGYFYKDDSFLPFLWKNAKQILLPYMLTIILQYVLCVLLKGMYWSEACQRAFCTIICGKTIPSGYAGSIGVLWFLTTLFGVRMLFWIVTRCCRENEWAKSLFVLLVVMAGIYVAQEGRLSLGNLPWSLDLVLVAVGVYYVGYQLKKGNVILELLRDKLCMVLCLCIWCLGLVRGIYLEFAWRSYPGELTCMVIAVAGSILCCKVSCYLEKVKVAKDVLSWLGRGTLVILCIHHLERELVSYESWLWGWRLFLARLVVILAGYTVFCMGKWVIRGGLKHERV
jgi:fucose 4-O-acetylase-like acetyltransferase